MKHFCLLISMLLLLPAGAKAQFAWYGSDGVAQVETGLGNGTGTNKGKWYSFSDNEKGGKSRIVWDVGTEPNDILVQQCGGISGTAELIKTGIFAYAGFGFNVAGIDASNNDYNLADATNWYGIAISYTSDIDIALCLSFGKVVDASLTDPTLGVDLPFVTLPGAPDGKFMRIPWYSFKQNGFAPKTINVLEAIKALACVEFRITDSSSGSYHFKISAIGSYTMPETSTTCKLVISATGNGSVTYSGTTLRDQTNSFTVYKDTNPKLTFSPDEGYKVKSVTVRGTDVTSDMSGNSYTINDIQGNTTVAVVFAKKSALKCATPTITFAGGKLKFSCETEDVVFSYEMTVEGAKSGYVINEVPVGALQSKYKVSVYAMKEGYENSDTATLEFSLDACDTNKDGTVDVADIATVIDKMAGN